ncbi:hypothetical protein IU501_31275 [Nocardia otitidiscaviarum]|uniref:Acg family FMN-binding oxidoreductase n=1 Tax=Nocardia otitidiscaviarum TaxID=1823 RepID=UPI0004A73D30|nr:hypothetical protein [Nocardia otitidiscaviarum]MBF6137458.1 hypothetical protein [Nocardia otitidiscaviarum]MBF6488280.1 hypothetical protein [Nocardia otitidiscaviarum]
MTAMELPPVLPDHRTIIEAMRLASRAPSVHNTQPWRWVFDGTRLHLYSDPDRLLHWADPRGRQLVISCGAMLHHVRTVFGAYGWHTDTVRLPALERPDHLAEIRFRPWADPPAGLRARAQAIDRRRTDRLPMAAPRGWDVVLPRLRMLVSPHYLELDEIGEAMRDRLAAASEQAAALRRHDIGYASELNWWAGHSGPDGIPPAALLSQAEAGRVRVGRAFPAGSPGLRRAEVEDRARLVVLSSPGDTLEHWLRTGEALSAVLLECTAAGLGTCPLTHLTELPSGRSLLSGLSPRPGQPQLVIRIGTAPEDEPEVAPSPRRPLADFFTTVRD